MASAEKDKLAADLSAYLDGELSAERASEVERLLAESPDARRTLDDLRAIAEGLAGLPRMRAPRDLSKTISRKSHEQARPGPPARIAGARLLKLVTRISASAALIAACVFAGWTILHQVETIPGSSRPEPAVRKAPAPPDSERGAFAARSSPGSSGQKGAKETDGAAAHADAPALALADESTSSIVERLEGIATGDSATRVGAPGSGEKTESVLQDALRSARAGRRGVHGEPVMDAVAETVRGISVDDLTPAIRIVVAPRDKDEYDASLRTLGLWRTRPPATAQGLPIDASTLAAQPAPQRAGRGRMAGVPVVTPTAAEPQSFELNVSTDLVNALLVSLDRQAPGQVRASLTFNVGDLAQVRRLVAPPADSFAVDESPRVVLAPAAPAESSPSVGPGERGSTIPGGAPEAGHVLEAEDSDKRGLSQGRVARGQPTRSAGAGVHAESKKTEEPVAGREDRAEPLHDAALFQRLRALGYTSESAQVEVNTAPAPPDQEENVDEQRQPLVSRVAAPVSAGIRPAAKDDRAGGDKRGEADTPERSEVAAGRSVGPVNDLGARLKPSADEWVGPAPHAGAPESRAEADTRPETVPVTLRITVLPPPAPAATQPASGPANVPAGVPASRE